MPSVSSQIKRNMVKVDLYELTFKDLKTNQEFVATGDKPAEVGQRFSVGDHSDKDEKDVQWNECVKCELLGTFEGKTEDEAKANRYQAIVKHTLKMYKKKYQIDKRKMYQGGADLYEKDSPL